MKNCSLLKHASIIFCLLSVVKSSYYEHNEYCPRVVWFGPEWNLGGPVLDNGWWRQSEAWECLRLDPGPEAEAQRLLDIAAARVKPERDKEIAQKDAQKKARVVAREEQHRVRMQQEWDAKLEAVAASLSAKAIEEGSKAEQEAQAKAAEESQIKAAEAERLNTERAAQRKAERARQKADEKTKRQAEDAERLREIEHAKRLKAEQAAQLEQEKADLAKAAALAAQQAKEAKRVLRLAAFEENRAKKEAAQAVQAEGVKKVRGQTLCDQGQQYYDQGEYAEALKAYTAAQQLGYALAHTKLGLMYVRGRGVEKDIPKARALFVEANQRAPTDPAVQCNIGISYDELGERVLADPYFKCAVDEWERWVTAENDPAAIENLMKVCINRPQSYSVPQLIAVLEAGGTENAARRACIKAVTFMGQANDEHLAKGQGPIPFISNELAALKLFMTVLDTLLVQKNPQDCYANIMVWKPKAEQQNHHICVGYLNMMLENPEIKPFVLLAQGKGALDPQEAVRVLEQARALAPHDPEILCNLGMSYEELGQEADALQFYKPAIEGFEAGASTGNIAYLELLMQLCVVKPRIYTMDRAIAYLNALVKRGSRVAPHWRTALQFVQKVCSQGNAAAGNSVSSISVEEVKELVALVALMESVKSTPENEQKLSGLVIQYRKQNLQFCLKYYTQTRQPQSVSPSQSHAKKKKKKG